MSQEERQIEVEAQTRQLLQGPLKHVRRAALAAALLPLASVAATPAAAQSAVCASAGIRGFVWNDMNKNGIQDGEPGIAGASVTLEGSSVPTDQDGLYLFLDGAATAMFTVGVQIPNNTQPSPANVGTDDTIDSDGIDDGMGNSVAKVTHDEPSDCIVDFGFFATPQQPGTGTPGYWKNHPEAWPDTITVGAVDGMGGVTYTRDQAIALLEKPGKDKTLTMFSSLVSAMLNVELGNDASCVASTIADANEWMSTYGPVGSNVAASSYAWKIGEPLHRLMDNYNNGMLCAPHRD